MANEDDTSAETNVDAEFSEEELFAAAAAERAAGKRFDQMDGDDGETPAASPDKGASAAQESGDPTPAKEEPREDGGDSGDGGAVADEEPAEEKPAEGNPAEEKPAPRAERKPAAKAFASFEEMLAEMGDTVLSGEGDDAVTIKSLAKDYPEVLQAMFKMSERMVAPIKDTVDPLQKESDRRREESERDSLFGKVEGDFPDARKTVASAEFSKWFAAQSDATKELGYSSDERDAKRLLQLYALDNPSAVAKKSGGAKESGEDAEKRKRRIGVVAGIPQSKPVKQGWSNALAQPGAEIELDDAESLFEQLAKRKR